MSRREAFELLNSGALVSSLSSLQERLWREMDPEAHRRPAWAALGAEDRAGEFMMAMACRRRVPSAPSLVAWLLHDVIAVLKVHPALRRDQHLAAELEGLSADAARRLHDVLYRAWIVDQVPLVAVHHAAMAFQQIDEGDHSAAKRWAERAWWALGDALRQIGKTIA